jgi:hypothetical protein
MVFPKRFSRSCAVICQKPPTKGSTPGLVWWVLFLTNRVFLSIQGAKKAIVPDVHLHGVSLPFEVLATKLTKLTVGYEKYPLFVRRPVLTADEGLHAAGIQDFGV